MIDKQYNNTQEILSRDLNDPYDINHDLYNFDRFSNIFKVMLTVISILILVQEQKSMVHVVLL